MSTPTTIAREGAAREGSSGPAADVRDSYTRAAVVLHWLLAALLLGQIGFGWFLTTVPRGTTMRGIYVNFHKSTGLTVAALIVVRIVWRLLHAPPPLPSFMPAWQRIAARGNHLALYAAMLVMPLSGYIASNFSKYGVKLYNAVRLPPWGGDDPRVYAIFNSIHVVTAYVFVAIIALHVLAAILHAVRRDRVFSRMLI